MLKKYFNVIFTLIFVQLFVFLTDDMYIPSVSTIAKDLNTTVYMVDYTFGLFFIGGAFAGFFVRSIMQYLNTQKTILLGIIMFCIMSALLFSVTSIYNMLLFRVIQGAAAAIIMNGNNTFIHLNHDRLVAAKMTSIIGSIGMIAPIIGPMLGIIIIKLFNWRYTFLFTSLMCVFSFIFVVLYLKDKVKVSNTNLRWSDIKVIARVGDFWKLVTSSILVFGCMLVWIIESPIVILEHTSSFQFSIIQAAVLLFFVLGLTLSTILMDKMKFKTLIHIGMFFVNILSALLFVVAYYYNIFYLELIIVSMILFFIAWCHGPLYRVSVESVPGQMPTVIAISGIMAGFIYGGLMLIFSFIHGKNIFIISTVMLCCILLQSFLYFTSDYFKSNDKN